MNEIEKKFLELYGEFNLTTQDPAYRIFKTGWNAGHQLEISVLSPTLRYCAHVKTKPQTMKRVGLMAWVQQ